MKMLVRFVFFAFLGLFLAVTQAQLTVDVIGVGSRKIPLAIGIFSGELQRNPGETLESIMEADLTRSGYFLTKIFPETVDIKKPPDFTRLKLDNVEALLVGNTKRLADNSYNIQFFLWDVVKGQVLYEENFTVLVKDLRLAAHYISDSVHYFLTGIKGVASTMTKAYWLPVLLI